MIALGKLHEALHELRPPTVALLFIVQVDDERLDVVKALFDRLPPVDQSIHQAVARHFGRNSIKKKFIGGWQENAHGRYRRYCFKVMVSGLGEDSTFTSPREGANLDGGFGIHREP